MNKLTNAGIMVCALGWIMMFFGSSIGFDVVNLHLLTISSMMIFTGLGIIVIGAIHQAATKVVDALSYLPEIGNGLASNADREIAITKQATANLKPAAANQSAPNASELRESLEKMRRKY
jgi:hypothetical protein